MTNQPSRNAPRVFSAIAKTALVAARGQAPAPAPTRDPGQVTLNRACTVCHALTEVSKFKGYWGRDQWADVVRTMRGDGAQVQDSEVPALVDYLFRTYGKTELPDGDGKKILESSCAGCHDLQVATKPRLTKSGWQDVVNRMVGMGAPLEQGQVPSLVDYLTKNFPAP